MSRAGRLKWGAQINGDRAEYIYMTLQQLTAEAYAVAPDFVKCPDYFTEDHFDITAKIPAGSHKEDAAPMLRSLLADRFKLAVHWEKQEEPVLALVAAGDGPKLKESANSDVPQPRQKVPVSGPDTIGGMRGSVAIRFTVDQAHSMVHLDAHNMPMRELARTLMRADMGNGRPIVDMTGLKGTYDISLDIPMSMIGAPPGETVSDPPENGRMLQSLKSLGLELKKTKAPVDRLIVDHAERKPSEN